MKTANYIFIVAILTMIFGCGTSAPEEGNKLPAIPVTVSKVVSSQEFNFIYASGKIEAKESADLSTRMMGRVTKLNVRVGERVGKGQQLLVLTNSDLLAKRAQVEASITQATSALENAEKDYKRFKTLFEKESASEKELDDMTTRYEMAMAGLVAAKQMKKEVEAQFAYTNITSPFEGVVINTFIKEGDMASPGVPLISVEGVNDFQSSALVSEADIAKISRNMNASVLVKSSDTELTGKVVEVSRSAKNTGGQYLVKIDLIDVANDVLPGMFVSVRFPIESTNASRVLVPPSSLVKQGQLTGIYTIGNEQTAILRWLRIGDEYNGQVEVLSGLQVDEVFISSADGKLYNGAKVTY